MGVKAGDMELVKAPLDFFGMNYYQRTIIAAAEPDKNRPGVDGRAEDGHGLGDLAGRILRIVDAHLTGIQKYTDGNYGERGIVPGRAGRAREDSGHAESRVFARLFERVGSSDEGRGGCSRLPLLEFAGQFRMGGRVHAAVWAGVCRFPRPEKDYQGIGGVVWEVGGDRKSEVKKEAKKQ